MGSQTCTVVRKPKTWGGCKTKYNGDCETIEFTEKMNELCMGLGDCGGSVNIIGEYSESYSVTFDGRVDRRFFLGSHWIQKLKNLAYPVEGQFAEVEDYSEYLEAVGLWGEPEEVEVGEIIDPEEMENPAIQDAAIGMAGVGAAAGSLTSGYTAVGLGWEGLGLLKAGSAANAGAAGFATVAIGAAIGMVAGSMLAKHLGLSEGGAMLMAIGGGIAGAAIGILIMWGSINAWNVVGLVMLAVGAILMVISSFFGGSKCDPRVISFECKAWDPPITGEKACDECNGDDLKPCSKYRCESLGRNCIFVNEGGVDEECIHNPIEDTTVPIVSMQPGLESDGFSFDENSDGFSVVGEDVECLDAYTNFTFGVATNEVTKCKFDVEPLNFEDMSWSLGRDSYTINHTVAYWLPDPSHGESHGVNWSGELTLYVKCKDYADLVSPGHFVIDMCVYEGDDITPPKVVASEPASGNFIGIDVDSQYVELVTNMPATCRWDLDEDIEYSDMRNELLCNDSLFFPSSPFGYSCNGTLNLGNATETYYFKCMDQPWLEMMSERNANVDPAYVLTLKKAEKRLSIDDIKPDSDFEINTDMTTENLKILTSGGADSHFCSWSLSGYDTMNVIFETGADRKHEAPMNLAYGKKKVYVECRDETGDFVRNSTEFEIIKDLASPAIARLWQDMGRVNLVLVESGECRFSFNTCRFIWDEGVVIGDAVEMSFSAIRGEKYYIKCKDEFGNVPSECSVELVAV